MTETYDPIQATQQKAQQAVKKETVSRPVRRYRTWVFQAYVLIAIALFSLLAVLASTSAYFAIDVTLTRFLQSIHSIFFDYLMQFISFFGYSIQGAVILIAAVVILFALGLRWEALMAAFAGISVELLNTIIKIVIHRPRPEANLVHVFAKVSGYSFPSGHVMFYTGFFGFLLFLSFTLLKSSWKRTLLVLVFGLLIVLVGPSRMYLGEHWASDVLGGYLAGSLSLAGSILIYRWGKPRFFIHQPVAKPDSVEVQQAKGGKKPE